MSGERGSRITDAQVEAAIEGPDGGDLSLPYGAQVRDYLPPDTPLEERAERLRALQAADAEADAQNRAFVRRVLEAALKASPTSE